MAERRAHTPQVAGSTPAPASTLTARQQAFVTEYLKDKNATQAYMRAYGVAKSTADNAGPRLLGNARVRAEIARHTNKVLEKVQASTGVTLERVVLEIAKVALHDSRLFWNPDGSLKKVTELGDAEASALAGFEVMEICAGSGEDRAPIGQLKKIKMAPRAPYLDMLMKHLGGYKKDNEQQPDAIVDALRAFFAHLHRGAGRIVPVREPGRAMLPPPNQIVSTC